MAFVAIALLALGLADEDKVVVSTAWWPPGSEKTAESVGTLSHGYLLMTGMMEWANANGSEAYLEMKDVGDIAVAGGTKVRGGGNLSGVVSCLVNTQAGARLRTKRAFAELLGPAVALTVVEMGGEYGDWFNTSTSCIGVQPGGEARSVVTRQSPPGKGARAYATSIEAGVPRRAHVVAEGANVSEVLDLVGQALGHTHGPNASMLENLVECTGYLASESLATELREALSAAATPPALTLLFGDFGESVILRCVAGVGSTFTKERVTLPGTASSSPLYAVREANLLHVSSIGAAHQNGTDGFETLERILELAGSRMDLVLNCHFYCRSTPVVQQLFDGFYQKFNVEAFPPPSRTEFVAIGAGVYGEDAGAQCGGTPCEVQLQCVAAMPTK